VQLAVKIGWMSAANETVLLPEHVHAPLTHVCPTPQTTPQPPQLLESDVVSTQELPQGVPPPAHWHAPDSQTRPPPQATPQPPQLLGSESVLMH
jgi:hypothetical protein